MITNVLNAGIIFKKLKLESKLLGMLDSHGFYQRPRIRHQTKHINNSSTSSQQLSEITADCHQNLFFTTARTPSFIKSDWFVISLYSHRPKLTFSCQSFSYGKQVGYNESYLGRILLVSLELVAY